MQQVTQHIQTPRGLTNLLETHFEIVSYIKDNADTSDKISTVEMMQGIWGLYELAEDLTFKFEHYLAQKDDAIEDGHFYLLEKFLDYELKSK